MEINHETKTDMSYIKRYYGKGQNQNREDCCHNKLPQA